MLWYKWLTLVAFVICFASCIFHLIRLIRLGNPVDYAKPSGTTGRAIKYSFTGAMSPRKKESAYLHLPTYTAGILFHLGTFLSMALLFIFFFNLFPFGLLLWIFFGFLMLSSLNGLGILIKRIVKKQLRSLSSPDDYISNLLVTGFQLLTALALINNSIIPVYFIWVSMLLLYLPLGKLKHTIYFFAARYHLGFFFGWRGTWPPKTIKY